MVSVGYGQRGLFSVLCSIPAPEIQDVKLMAAHLKENVIMWHSRLARINLGDLSTIQKHLYGFPSLGIMSKTCQPCQLEKAHKLLFGGRFKQSSFVGEIIHSDIVESLSAFCLQR